MKNILVIVLCVVVLMVLFFRRDEYFSRQKVESTNYFYFRKDSCIQRALIVDELGRFENYCQWYVESDRSFDEGVRLQGIGCVSLDPFKVVEIHSSGILKNGIEYCFVTQRFGKKGRKIAGYTIKEYLRQEALIVNEVQMCDEYLEGTWQDLHGNGSNPIPLEYIN